MRRVSAIVMVGLLLSAGTCNRNIVRNERVSLEPSDQHSFSPSVYIYPANSTWWPCLADFDSSGTGSNPALWVGYARTYKSGRQPLPCDQQWNSVFWTAVKFDLSALQRDPPPFIVSARLSFDKIRLNGDPECEDKVYTATGPWPHDKGLPTAEEVYNLPVPLLTSAGCKGSRCTMEVRGQVDLWIRGLMPNHGFIFNPVNTSLYVKENRSCMHEYRNMRLDVDYAYGVTPPVPIRRPVPLGFPDLRPTPTTGTIVLTVTKVDAPSGRGYQLQWTGAGSAPLDLYRNGAIFATVGSGGAYLDATPPAGTVNYQVCISGKKTNCSAVVSAPL